MPPKKSKKASRENGQKGREATAAKRAAQKKGACACGVKNNRADHSHLHLHPHPAAGAHMGDKKEFTYFGHKVTEVDMKRINEIEALPDQSLWVRNDWSSAEDQQLTSLVRQKKRHDKEEEARATERLERKRERAERWAAGAPARAAKRERERTEREAQRALARADPRQSGRIRVGQI